MNSCQNDKYTKNTFYIVVLRRFIHCFRENPKNQAKFYEDPMGFVISF